MKKDVINIFVAWKSKYYNNEIDDDSYAQMRADVLKAGCISVLAYRQSLLVTALKYGEN